ncbi:MAG: hypothetical protein FWH52_01630 [Synergistaceae bacterium]|nr:hypothetical protein [Synergistaceae bacterium]
MAKKPKKPFRTLAVRYNGDCPRTSIFTIDDDIGDWIDPCYDAIVWNEFSVYGIPDTETDMDKVLNDDFESAVTIGDIFGCHISKALIINLGEDPYVVCDDENADLEAMYSVLREHEEDFEYLDFYDNIYYIHEIELHAEYQNLGYEKILLQQLPAIIVRSLHVFPSLLLYYPRPTRYDEKERDEEAEAILRHRLNYRMQNILKSEHNGNISLFPPKREVPLSEINRYLGRRNPGDVVPEANRNQEIYRLYKSVGFKEIGNTGWLFKIISSIYTKDGLNH